MIVKCNHCGAPLDVPSGASKARCRYCGTQSRVRSMQTLHAQTPAAWRQPEVWVPPPEARAPSVPLPAQSVAVAAAGTGCAIVLVPIVVLVAIAGAVGVAIMRRAPSTWSQAPHHTTAGPRSWDGASPLLCSGNERVVSVGVHARADNQVVIASGKCEIELRGATLEGKVGVVLADEARLVMKGGAVLGSEYAAIVSQSARLVLEGPVELSGMLVVSQTAAVVGPEARHLRGRVLTSQSGKVELGPAPSSSDPRRPSSDTSLGASRELGASGPNPAAPSQPEAERPKAPPRPVGVTKPPSKPSPTASKPTLR